jgi:nucleotide-binding universal stress UspA family protein
MRFRKIVAAVDETPAGMHALRAAAIVASAADAELMALRIVHDPWSYVRPDEVEPLRARGGRAPADLAEERCLTELRQLITDTPEAVRARPVIRFGIPGIELPRWARLEGADLLVLGRQPHGTFERRPADRTIDLALRQAAVPCLIVPFGQRTWRTVLAVLDADAGASRVGDTATAFAALWGSRPRIVRLAPAGVAHGVAHPAEGGASDTMELGGADPVGETIKLARDEGAEAIVVGYVGQVQETAEGGMAWRLVQRAPCSVLTVPVNEEER